MNSGDTVGNYMFLNQKRNETAVVSSEKLQVFVVPIKNYLEIFGDTKDSIEVISSCLSDLFNQHSPDYFKDFINKLKIE